MFSAFNTWENSFTFFKLSIEIKYSERKVITSMINEFSQIDHNHHEQPH